MSETDPRGWAEYLRVTSDVRRAASLREPELLREFTQVFGNDLRMLEARYLRFIDEL